MKNLALVKNIYTVILFMTLVASLLQLDYLKSGIISGLMNLPGRNEKLLAESNCTDCKANAQEVNPEKIEFKPERVVIEKAGIDLPVIWVPLENGTWQVYPAMANYAEGTNLVNKETGNVVIYGHDRPDAFTTIKQLLTGDDIIVYGQSYRAYYKVEETFVTVPEGVQAFYPTKEPKLTLMTCDGIFSENRYMVRAELIRIEKNDK